MTLTLYTVIGYLLMAGIYGAVILGLIFWGYVIKWTIQLGIVAFRALFPRKE